MAVNFVIFINFTETSFENSLLSFFSSFYNIIIALYFFEVGVTRTILKIHIVDTIINGVD